MGIKTKETREEHTWDTFFDRLIVLDVVSGEMHTLEPKDLEESVEASFGALEVVTGPYDVFADESTEHVVLLNRSVAREGESEEFLSRFGSISVVYDSLEGLLNGAYENLRDSGNLIAVNDRGIVVATEYTHEGGYGCEEHENAIGTSAMIEMIPHDGSERSKMPILTPLRTNRGNLLTQSWGDLIIGYEFSDEAFWPVVKNQTHLQVNDLMSADMNLIAEGEFEGVLMDTIFVEDHLVKWILVDRSELLEVSYNAETDSWSSLAWSFDPEIYLEVVYTEDGLGFVASYDFSKGFPSEFGRTDILDGANSTALYGRLYGNIRRLDDRVHVSLLAQESRASSSVEEYLSAQDSRDVKLRLMSYDNGEWELRDEIDFPENTRLPARNIMHHEDFLWYWAETENNGFWMSDMCFVSDDVCPDARDLSGHLLVFRVGDDKSSLEPFDAISHLEITDGAGNALQSLDFKGATMKDDKLFLITEWGMTMYQLQDNGFELLEAVPFWDLPDEPDQ